MEYDEAEQARINEANKKKQETQKILREQLRAAKLKKVRELKEEYLEGVVIKKQSLQAVEDEKMERAAAR